MRFTILAYENEEVDGKLKYVTRIFVEANTEELALEKAKRCITKKIYTITEIDATMNSQMEIADALKKHLQ